MMEIPLNDSSGPPSFLEGSSAGMLGERDTGGEGYSSGPLFFLERSSPGMLGERDTGEEGK